MKLIEYFYEQLHCRGQEARTMMKAVREHVRVALPKARMKCEVASEFWLSSLSQERSLKRP